MTTVAVCITTDCPTCAGAGVVATRQDYWGNWDDETCRTCSGTGSLGVQEAADYRASLCIHGEVIDHDCCGLCVYARSVQPTPDEVRVLWPNGWEDMTPPF